MEGEKQLPKQLEIYKWKKGQSGNPAGRPPGKTLKEFAREYLMSLPDEEKVDYLSSLPTDIVWKMAEGNPANATDLTTGGDKVVFNVIAYGNNNTVPLQSEAVPTETTESTG